MQPFQPRSVAPPLTPGADLALSEARPAEGGHASEALFGRIVGQGYVWSVLGFGATQIASTAFFLLLARQLDPETFGVYALAVLLVQLVTIQGKSSAVDALLQAGCFEPRVLSGFFYALLVICAGLAAGISSLSAVFSGVFHTQALLFILPVLSCTMVLTPAECIMEALVMRQLGFKTLALRNTAGTMVGGVLGVLVAFSPARNWALVAQSLAASIVTVGFLFTTTGFVPRRPVFATVPGLLAATGQIWFSQAFASCLERVGDVIVGAQLGPAQLGIFRVAGRVVNTLHGPITGPIMSLWVPVMSAIQHGSERSKRTYIALSSVSALICLPAFLGLALTGPDLTHLLLSPDYDQAAAIIPWLCLIGLFIPVGYFRGPILIALGRNRLGLVFWTFDLVLVSSVFAAAAPHGLLAVAKATTVPLVINGALSLTVVLKLLKVRFSQFLPAVLPAYVAAGIMVAITKLVQLQTLGLGPLGHLLLAVGVGILVYTAVLLVCFRTWLFDILRFLRGRTGTSSG